MRSDLTDLGRAIAAHAEADGAAPAIESGGRIHTRADIQSAALGLRDLFAAQGLGAGSAPVGLVVAEPLRGIEALLALWSLGAAAVFFDLRMGADHIRQLAARAGARDLLTDTPQALRGLEARALPPREALAGQGQAGQIQAGQGPLSFPPDAADRAAYLVSSSGTTGVPRFNAVSHRGAVAAQNSAGARLDLPPPLPGPLTGSLAFGAALNQWMRMLYHGCFAVSLPLFHTARDLDAVLSRPDIRIGGAAPVMIRDLLALHRGRAGIAYPNLVRFTSLGGPISAADAAEAYRVLTPTFRNLYSMTGVGAVSVLSGEDVLTRPGSVGRVGPGARVEIQGPDGQLCAPGEVGDIIAYARLRGDQRVDSGDRGYFDADGYLYVTGRKAQMACRNAVNIDMGEIEADVLSVPHVRDCIAFSVPDADGTGDRIVLAVESRAAPDQITAALRAKLSSHRRPDLIRIAPQLPRTGAGKLALAALRQAALDGSQTYEPL